MATISQLTTAVDGNTLTASIWNAEFQNIINDYNGGITDANISASAAISASKISGAVTASSSDTFTNKSISGSSNTLTNIPTTALSSDAVTQVVGTNNTTGYTTTNASYEDIDGTNLSKTITTVGGDVLVFFQGSWKHSTINSIGSIQIVKDASTVIALNNKAFDAANWDTFCLMAFDSAPSAGSHTYKLQFKTTGGGTLTLSESAYSNNFVVVEFKR